MFSLTSQFDQLKSGLINPLRSFTDVKSTLGKNGLVALPGTVAAAASEFTSGGSAWTKHTLLGANARSDPLLNYMWFCDPPAVSGITLPWYYVEEFVAPFRSFDVKSQYRQGKMYHFAGQHSISNLTMRFYDDSTGKVGGYLEGWRRTVLNESGLYGYPSSYKKTINVHILDVTKFGTVYSFKYVGCWPSSPEPFSLGSASSDRLISTQEFSCDEVILQVRNFPPFSLVGILKEGFDRLGGLNGMSGNFQNMFLSSTNDNTVANISPQTAEESFLA